MLKFQKCNILINSGVDLLHSDLQVLIGFKYLWHQSLIAVVNKAILYFLLLPDTPSSRVETLETRT